MKAKIVSSLAALGWLAACSTPVPPEAATGGKSVRDLQLIEAPANQPGISDLEAGRPVRPRANRPIERRLADQPVPAPEPESMPTLVESAVVPAVDEPADQPVGGPSAAAQASVVPAEEVVEIRDRGLPMGFQAPGGDYPAIDGSEGFTTRRGPTILIRGGRGGVDDDCDLHRPGAHGNHGVAINRTSPSISGGLRGSGPSRVGGRLGAGIR